MGERSRRRVLAAGASLLTVLPGCTGDGETTTDSTTGGTTTETPTTHEPTTDEATSVTERTDETTPADVETGEQTSVASATTEPGTTTVEGSATTTRKTTTTAEPVERVSVGPAGSRVFNPSSVTVAVGDVVRWEWASNGHNVCVSSQPDDADWEGTDGGPSVTYDTGYVHEHRFEVAGTYEYYCAPHQSAGMTGVVTVE